MKIKVCSPVASETWKDNTDSKRSHHHQWEGQAKQEVRRIRVEAHQESWDPVPYTLCPIHPNKGSRPVEGRKGWLMPRQVEAMKAEAEP